MSDSRAKVENPSVYLLRQFLNYDPHTGAFSWRKRNRNPAMAGRICNAMNQDGYVRVCFKGKKYFAHRLAWFYITGLWPTDELDHRNGIRHDNRWKNLRESTRSLNMQNRRHGTKGSATGILGVYKKSGRFFSSIKVSGEQIYLGKFSTALGARRAYIAAKRKLHPGAIL